MIAGTGFARPACLLVSYASTFKAQIVLEYKGVSVNLKDSSESIMNVMSLGIKPV
ncbi:HPr family phosphocarrier protein [Halalkalibacter alkalisediminis]|uniref:HPr family phosphocarrier protein n=1 Tax=Halalkalibacter alkalisediminis TaxID=935616 RepID=A0ABV6NL15_9BACI